MRRGLTYCILITLLIIVLLGVSLLVGAVDIPADKVIVVGLHRPSVAPPAGADSHALR